MAEKKIKKVPKLRFPGFEGGWEVKKLGEVCQMQAGKFIPASNIYESDSNNDGEKLHPCYGGNGLRGYTQSFTHIGKFNLIGRQGALCGNITLASGIFHATEHAVVVTQNEEILVDWLYYSLICLNLNKYATGQAQPGLSVDTLQKISIIVPSNRTEQQTIATFLTAVDTRIQQLSRKKALLEQYKKGVMQQLFSQQIRFKDEQGQAYPDWEEKRLGEVCNFLSTNSLSRSQLNYAEGLVKNIHYGDIHTKFQSALDVTKEEIPFVNGDVDISKIPVENYCIVGDLIVADASEDYKDVGKAIEIINTGGQKVLAGLHTLMLRDNKGHTAIGYKGYLMQSHSVRQQIMKMATGVSVLGIAKTNLSKVVISLPCIEEQQKIATFLTAIDQKITRTNQQLQGIQQYKKGLLQQLFV